MSEGPELTQEDLAKVFGRKKRYAKPIAFGLIGVGGIAVLLFVGKSFLTRNPQETTEKSPIEEISLINRDTTGLSGLLFDTLELAEDGIYDLNDSVELPIRQLTGTQVDSSEYVEIPGTDYLDNSELLNGLVSGEEILLDSSLEFDLAIAASMRPGQDFSSFGIATTSTDTFRQQPIDTAAIIAALKPQLIGTSQAQIDSLKAVAETKEQTLQLLAANNQELSTKLVRYKPKIDSTRAVQVKRLVKIIETMSPSAAANMLSTQTTDEITEILFRVKPRKAAQIIQQLPPGMAADITVRVVRQ